MPPGSPKPSPTDAVDALKRRYEERLAQVKRAQARKYAETGAQALAAGDVLAALNGFRVASGLAPDDAALKKALAEVEQSADTLFGETYQKQAEYEERSGRWTDAARSWARVAKARPQDPHANERAAHATLKGGGDLREAVRLGRIAVDLRPNEPSYRVTLAEAYRAAGMQLNAKRELETGLRLAPGDAAIAELLTKLS
jgi:tetratricopeptide (TPR) repeat protein